MSTESHYVCNLDTMDWHRAQDFETTFAGSTTTAATSC